MAATVARAIRAERGRLGLSQEELAQRLGWVRQTVQKIEAGDRAVAVHELPEICGALEVGLLELLERASAADRALLRL